MSHPASSAPETHLSHILTASTACHILGQDHVRQIVRSFLRYVAAAGGAGTKGGVPRTVVGGVMGVGGGGGMGGTLPKCDPRFSLSPAHLHPPPLAPSAAAVSPNDPSAPFPLSTFSSDPLDPDESSDEADWIDHLGRALFFDYESHAAADDNAAAHADAHADADADADAATGENYVETPPIPPDVELAWRRMVSTSGAAVGIAAHGVVPATFPVLGLDKASALKEGALLPPPAVPHPGPGGHLALMECIFHALAYVPSSGDGGGGGGNDAVAGIGGGLASGGSGSGSLPPSAATASSPPPKPGSGGKKKKKDRKAELKAAVEQRMMSASASVHGRARSVVLLPDMIIFFAVCRQYRNECKSKPALAKSEERRRATAHASLLAFRVYDAYQKRGTVSREVVRRFLADVHGEGLCNKPAVGRILDAMFTVQQYGKAESAFSPNAARTTAVTATSPGASVRLSSASSRNVDPAEFCRGVASTVSVSKSGRSSHVLLDWIMTLGNSMLPDVIVPTDVALFDGAGASVRQLLCEKREVDLESDPALSLRCICKRYGVGRRQLSVLREQFHNLVQSSAKIFHNLSPASLDDTGTCMSDLDRRRLPLHVSEGRRGVSDAELPSRSSTHLTPQSALHVEVFVHAACSSDADTLQHGGILSPSLARLTFVGERIVRKRRRDWVHIRDDGPESHYWTLRDVTEFCCRALREEPPGECFDACEDADVVAERSLLELIFAGFLALPSSSEDRDVLEESFGEFEGIGDFGDGSFVLPNALSRTQIGHMIVLLLEHAEFRLRADSPDAQLETFGEKEKKVKSTKAAEGSDEEKKQSSFCVPDHTCVSYSAEHSSSRCIGDSVGTVTVDASAASILGMLPQNLDGDNAVDSKGGVRLDVLIDFVLDESVVPDAHGTMPERPSALSFTGFVNWHRGSNPNSFASVLPWVQRRAGPLMLDLRILAGMVFGMKPADPDMEQTLIAEATRRHSYRHPAAEPNSKRGPPGTAWNLVEARWWRSWQDQSGGSFNSVSVGRRRRSPSFCSGDDTSVLSFDMSEAGSDGDLNFNFNLLGRIDNRVLLEPGGLALRRGLKWQRDFELVSPMAWRAIQTWYDGGPSIRRMVVPCKSSQSSSSLGSLSPKWNVKTGGTHSGLSPPSIKGKSGRASSLSVPPTHNEIELYPLCVHVLVCNSSSCRKGSSEPMSTPTSTFSQDTLVSRHLPAQDLLTELCLDVGGTTPQNARIWVLAASLPLPPQAATNEATSNVKQERDVQNFLLYPDAGLERQLCEKGISVDLLNSGPSTTTESASVCAGRTRKLTLVLELRDGIHVPWPRALRSNVQLLAISGTESDKGVGGGVVTPNGNIGLYNMGNSGCLNSSIQCLSHTSILREYFRSDSYLNDINRSNPLGQEGELAEIFSALIKELWKRGSKPNNAPFSKKSTSSPRVYSPVQAPALTPKSLKEAVERFNNSFEGRDHYDAQEMLLFLLSALSKDLSLVDGNPSEDPASSNERSGDDDANIWLTEQLNREMSIITELFAGQYKSVLTCQTCNHIHTDFGSSFFLSLSLPQDDLVSVHLIFYPLGNGHLQPDTAVPTKYVVRVKQEGTLKDVLVSLVEVLLADKTKENGRAGKAGDKPFGASISIQNELIAADYTREGGHENGFSSVENDEKGVAQDDGHAVHIGEDINNGDIIAHEQYAQNMVIVTMANSSIVNVVPSKWPLFKMRNKETGDVDLLHVYELDPLPTQNCGDFEAANRSKPCVSNGCGADARPTDDCAKKPKHSDSKFSDGSSVENVTDAIDPSLSSTASVDTAMHDKSKRRAPKDSFLAFVQRKLDLATRSLLHPFLLSTFGTPFILRIRNLEKCTGRDLYDLVAKKIRCLVPRSVWPFLLDRRSSLPASVAYIANIDGAKQSHSSTIATDSCIGKFPRYGFFLRITTREGKCCAVCPWFECCSGCLLPDDECRVIATNGDTIALDWHMMVDLKSWGFGLAKEEGLSSRPVDRGTELLHTSRAVRRHITCTVGANEEYFRSLSLEECLDKFYTEEMLVQGFCTHCNDTRPHTRRKSCVKLPPILIVHLKRFRTVNEVKQKLRDLVCFPVEGVDFMRILGCKGSFESQEPPIDEGEGRIFQEEETIRSRIWADRSGHGSREEPSSGVKGRPEPVYDVYAIIHHQGAPFGGHYVASIKSEIDGNWRLFNDAALYEVNADDVVDSSAYIIFYVRRDIKGTKHGDFWDPTRRQKKDSFEGGESVCNDAKDASTPKKWFRWRHR